MQPPGCLNLDQVVFTNSRRSCDGPAILALTFQESLLLTSLPLCSHVVSLDFLARDGPEQECIRPCSCVLWFGRLTRPILIFFGTGAGLQKSQSCPLICPQICPLIWFRWCPPNLPANFSRELFDFCVGLCAKLVAAAPPPEAH